VNESLHFLASGLTIETRRFPGDGPVRLERFRRLSEYLQAASGDYDDDRRRIAADREEAKAYFESKGTNTRLRAAASGFRVLPNPFASAMLDRAAFRKAAEVSL
jgi:hypothetical protein